MNLRSAAAPCALFRESFTVESDATKRFEKKELNMSNRNEENREKFEGGRGQGGPGEQERNWQNRGYSQGYRSRGSEGQSPFYGPGGPGDFRNEPWQGERGPWGEEGRYGNQRQFEGGRRYDERGYGDQGYNDRGYSEGVYEDFGNRDRNEDMRRADWDRSHSRSMTMTYPRQNEWSQGHGISTGLGGSENSEYASYPRSGSYYGGQGQFGGGLGQYGEQGRHAGHGPKGYKRSDERIKEDVNERLTQDSQIDAGEIEVEVKNGEVTLTGTVESRQAKRRAEDVIENVSGVNEVHNQLRVHWGQETTAGTTSGAAAGKQSSHGPKS
jgi:hypothetical protein